LQLPSEALFSEAAFRTTSARMVLSMRSLIIGSLSAALAHVEAAVPLSPTFPASPPAVLVTGATGQTGAATYRALKETGEFDVRAFVRNATKAKLYLGCDKCDESEGVFLGDLNDPPSLVNAMKGVDKLVIATAAVARCTGTIPIPPFGSCSYPEGAAPIDIDWKGTKAQVTALASNGGNSSSKQVAYVSAGGTQTPNSFFDKIGNGHISFYKLNAESFIMSSGLSFTIVKPCGLGTGAPGKNKLVVGHDGDGFDLKISHTIQRSDVARVLVESLRNPADGAGLRFDVCSQAWGAATTDIVNDVFKPAMYPWDKRQQKHVDQGLLVV